MVSEEGPEGRNPGEEGSAEGGPEAADPHKPPPGSIRELILASAPDPSTIRPPEEEEEKPSAARRALVLALVLAAALLLFFVLTAGSPYRVKAEFANASQVVKGNEVVVGGARVGSVEEIELGEHGEALITFSVSEDYAPLERGTVATVRAPSLSQIAGRQIQLTLPASGSGGEEIADGGTLSQAETVSAVDLDQLFNTLDPETIEDFKHVIQGFELSYEGVGERANRAYHYLNPFLSTSRRVFGELSADQRAFENLIVDTSQLSGALAGRASELSALVGNLDSMMNAIGDRKTELAEAISLFPGFMRSANTTFVNLRAALDDLDPLIVASRPAARELEPFLAQLRAAVADAVPTIAGLDAIVKRQGRANDLVELTAAQPELATQAVGSGEPDCGPGAENPDDLAVAADGDYRQGAFGESVCALENSLGNLSFLRAYTPEVLGWFNTFSHVGNMDATGDGAMIALTANTFSPSTPLIPNLANLVSPEEALAGMNVSQLQRCPGRNEHPVGSGDDSIPFTDGDALTDGSHANGECDPEQGILGP